MANTVTQSIEDQLISFATSLYAMNAEVIDLYQYYWGSTAHTLVDGLASNSTPATTASSGSFSKSDFLNGITLVDQLQKFFGNQAVTTGDYLSSCDTLRNANTAASVALSRDVEDIGARMKAIVLDLIQLNKNAANLEKIYNASSLSSVIGSIPSSTIVFGCSLSQAKLVSGIVLVQQYQKLLGNQAVTTGDYLATITNLVAGS